MASGSGDGVGTGAAFSSPFRAAITPDGATALVTDTYNCKIRSVNLSSGRGEVTTFAGTGCDGGPVVFDGIATSAQLGKVSAIAISPDGRTVLVSDDESPVIRAIDMSPPNNVSIFAGASGSFAAGISGLAFSSDGARVFVVDKNNFAVRVVDVASRKVNTVLSDLEYGAFDISMSSDDQVALTVADETCDLRIINVDDASVRTLAGGDSGCGLADGVGTRARFGSMGDSQMSRFSIDLSPDGTVALVGDWANHAIRMVDVQSREVKTLAGSGNPDYSDGHGRSASFQYPTGVTFFPDGSAALVVDRYNHLLRVVKLGECKNCTAGTYSRVNNATSCNLCPSGKFQALAGATTCSVCPSGTTSSLGSSECVCIGSDCPGQEIGYGRCNGVKHCGCGAGNCSCGSYRSSDCPDYCCPCPLGSYCDCFSACEGMPKPCPEGSFSRVLGASDPGACMQCPEGHICNKDSGTTEPLPCPVGHFCPVHSVEKCPIPADPCQIPCPAGTAGNRSGMPTLALACMDCPAGFFSSTTGNQQCSACLPGSYNPRMGSSSCEACPVGHFCMAKASFPEPCPENSYNPVPGASSPSFCKPCEQGKLSPAGAPSSEFCNNTETTVPPTTSRDTSTTTTTSTPIVLQTTPPPLIVQETPQVFFVQARAEIGGIEGQAAFEEISTYFKAILADMVHLSPSDIHVQEICDDANGCTQVSQRKLLQAGSILVRFTIETTNEMKLVESLLDPSFSFIFASRLASETGIKTLTANVELASTVSLSPSSLQDEPDVPSMSPSAADSSAAFSLYAIGIGACIFVFCNLFWFRKSICRCLACKARNRASAESDKFELPVQNDDLSPDRHKPVTRVEGVARQYLHEDSGTFQPRIDNSSRSEGSQDSDHQVQPSFTQPPAHEPLSLVVRPPKNIMTGLITSAQAPDEALLAPSLIVAPHEKPENDLQTDQTIVPPRTPAALCHDSRATTSGSQSGARTRTRESPMVEMHASASSGHSMSKSESEESGGVAQEDIIDGKDQAGTGLLDETGFFKLDDTRCAYGDGGDLGASDLAPLFDMVSLVDGSERYIDSDGLQEILSSLRPSSSPSTVDAVYSALGLEANSRLSLLQLQAGWSALGEKSPFHRPLRDANMEKAGSFDLGRSRAEDGGSVGSWDSDRNSGSGGGGIGHAKL